MEEKKDFYTDKELEEDLKAINEDMELLEKYDKLLKATKDLKG